MEKLKDPKVIATILGVIVLGIMAVSGAASEVVLAVCETVSK